MNRKNKNRYMIPIIETLRQIRRGKYRTVNSLVKYSSASNDRMREVLDDLVDEDYMIKLTSNFYVIRDLSDEEMQSYLDLIRKKSKQLENETEQRTKVSISGSLVENKTYKTDKEPSEIL